MYLNEFFKMRKRRTKSFENAECSTNSGFKTKLNDYSFEVQWEKSPESPKISEGKQGCQVASSKNDDRTLDVSYIVEKLSKNTSPVVKHGSSAFLEMWLDNIGQAKNNDDCSKNFKSPPFQRRYTSKKSTSTTSTPSLQRRSLRHQKRKLSRQFQIEIRKLVDEIQCSDISGSSSQSQNDSQNTISNTSSHLKKVKKRSKLSLKKVTPMKPALNNNMNDKNFHAKDSTLPTGKISSKPLICEDNSSTLDNQTFENSYKLMEDDMDDLLLTCQLSSSANLTVSVAYQPCLKCGESPNEMGTPNVPESFLAPNAIQQEVCTEIPETQILFSDHEEDTKINESELNSYETTAYEREISAQSDHWFDDDDDDIILATAVQEYEKSQELHVKGIKNATVDVKKNKIKDEIHRQLSSGEKDQKLECNKKVSNRSSKHPSLLHQSSTSKAFNTLNVASKNEKNKIQFNTCKYSHHVSKNNHDRCFTNIKSFALVNDSTSSPLQNISGNVVPKATKKYGSREMENKMKASDSNDFEEAKRKIKKSSSKIHSDLKEFEFFNDDELDDLLDNINFDELLSSAIKDTPFTTANRRISPANPNCQVTTPKISTKIFTSEEIEKKRLEAQRRRLEKAKQKRLTLSNKMRYSKKS